MDPLDIVAEIEDGALDEALNEIEKAIRRRRTRQIHDLQHGDRVRIVGNISPKYFQGGVGKVLRWERSRSRNSPYKVTVVLEDARLRERGVRYVNRADGSIVVPSNCLEKID